MGDALRRWISESGGQIAGGKREVQDDERENGIDDGKNHVGGG